MKKNPVSYPCRIIVDSPLGDILVQGNQTHIQSLKFSQRGSYKPVVSDQLPHWNSDCRKQLGQYFLGTGSLTESFEFDLPIDPQGTEFQQRVWQALFDIKYGTFSSYQELAVTIGNINAVRAIASANARNPIWLIVPCHRVIGSDNALRGYAGGIERKAKLLQLEHHQLDAAEFASINEKTKILS